MLCSQIFHKLVRMLDVIPDLLAPLSLDLIPSNSCDFCCLLFFLNHQKLGFQDLQCAFLQRHQSFSSCHLTLPFMLVTLVLLVFLSFYNPLWALEQVDQYLSQIEFTERSWRNVYNTIRAMRIRKSDGRPFFFTEMKIWKARKDFSEATRGVQ